MQQPNAIPKWKAYADANRERINERRRQDRVRNYDATVKAEREYREANKGRIAEQKRQRYVANADLIRLREQGRRNSDPEKAREQQRRSYQRNKEAYSERSKKYVAKNRELAASWQRRWRAENAERARELVRLWNEANPGKRAAYGNRRRARILASRDEHHTAGDVIEALNAQAGKCANPLCGVRVGTRYHVDHIIPLARGGSNAKENIQVLCPTCNLRKNRWTMAEFLERQMIETERVTEHNARFRADNQ